MSVALRDMSGKRLVGAEPWLPWPLSAWRWWTEPVAAERLAALRIGLAALLLVDICWTYLPNLNTFFLEGGPGSSAIFGWYSQSPRWTWSLLRGLNDPLIHTLFLFGWIALTVGIILDFLTRDGERVPRRRQLWIGWIAAGVGYALGTWVGDDLPRWLVPGLLAALAILGVIVEWLARWIARVQGREQRGNAFPWLALTIFAGLACWGAALGYFGLETPWLTKILGPWQDDPILLRVSAGVWALSAVLLLVGWKTRTAAIAAWVLSASFANLNPNIDNAGDVIRGIVLFYLMLSPCEAVWSVDAAFQRRNLALAGDADWPGTLISPWALRLLFVQLVLIYFMNGLYKLGGENWWRGDSLHYVFCDLTLTRFSYAQLPAPVWLTRLATWLVLAWEVGFPLWVSLPWTRRSALWFGVLFHLGIYATMELGNFVPYILTLYLPLLPWERWTFHRRIV